MLCPLSSVHSLVPPGAAILHLVSSSAFIRFLLYRRTLTTCLPGAHSAGSGLALPPLEYSSCEGPALVPHVSRQRTGTGRGWRSLLEWTNDTLCSETLVVLKLPSTPDSQRLLSACPKICSNRTLSQGLVTKVLRPLGLLQPSPFMNKWKQASQEGKAIGRREWSLFGG